MEMWLLLNDFFNPDFKSLKEEITIHIFFSIKGKQKVENSLTHVTSGVWSHSHFSARINSTCEQLFRADELPKMALERKKQTGSCLTFFQVKKQTLISWSWLAWAELRSLWSVFITNHPWWLLTAHQHHTTDLVGLMCVSILAPSTQSAADGMRRAVQVLTYGEKQSRRFRGVFADHLC